MGETLVAPDPLALEQPLASYRDDVPSGLDAALELRERRERDEVAFDEITSGRKVVGGRRPPSRARQTLATELAVTSAADALATLDKGWDIVLSDFRMPIMDGVDFLEEVARRSPTIRRVMLTSTPGDSKVTTAVERGVVHAVLGKPVRWEDLRGALGTPG